MYSSAGEIAFVYVGLTEIWFGLNNWNTDGIIKRENAVFSRRQQFDFNVVYLFLYMAIWKCRRRKANSKGKLSGKK